MIDWRKNTFETLKALGIKPSKNRGQNFLIRPGVVKRMVSNAFFSDDSQILEVGGGLGILSKELIDTGKQIHIIEKDRRLATYLEREFPKANIITDDALKIDWSTYTHLIANLPYSISSPILEKLFHSNIKQGIVMIQKEVAQRCVAKPGTDNFSRLSIITNLHTTPEILFDVTPQAFFPQPKVTSSIIKFTKNPLKTENSHLDIELLARNLFSLRRRTLRSVVRGFLKRKTDKNVWDKLESGNKRIYELEINELDQITSFLKAVDLFPLA